MGLVTEHSLWLGIFCIISAGFFAWWLYRKDRRFHGLELWKIRLMAAFRFTAIFLISFFLLNPMIKALTRYIEKPIVIVAQDFSESIIMSKDSVYYKDKYLKDLHQLVNDLGRDFDVITYSFGEKVDQGIDSNYSRKTTSFDPLFRKIEGSFSNRNLGAVILASDGIFNKGANPIFMAEELGAKLYAIPLGDTIPQKDLMIADVFYNDMAFLGNNFPVKLKIKADYLKGEKSRLSVSRDKEVLYSEDLELSSDHEFITLDLTLPADKPGLQRYYLKLEPIKDERSIQNNQAVIVIDIIDQKQKVLILADGPHPDVGAVRRVLDGNQNIETDYIEYTKFDGNVDGYNLLVLFQLPSGAQSATSLFESINSRNIPVLMVMGNKTDIKKFNALNFPLNIQSRKRSTDQSKPGLNKNFTAFTVLDDAVEISKYLPPLECPFGNYKVPANAEVLFFQKIGSVETSKPLFLLHREGEQKIGIICGEGIWRWPLILNAEYGNQEFFNDIINKTVQFLSLTVGKDNFVVKSKRIFNENENIEFNAELYNNTFEMVNQFPVSLTITNSKGDEFLYSFRQTHNAYTLDAGAFPPGDYTYAASAELGDEMKIKKGAFSVIPINIAASDIVADNGMLSRLSGVTNGRLLRTDSLSSIPQILRNDDEIASVSYTEKSLIDLINIRWLFFVILALLTVEWFMRKYLGSY